jgi:hypothetical protein
VLLAFFHKAESVILKGELSVSMMKNRSMTNAPQDFGNNSPLKPNIQKA